MGGRDGRQGWRSERVRDLGGPDAATALAMYMPLSLRLMGTLGTAQFNFRIVGPEQQAS